MQRGTTTWFKPCGICNVDVPITRLSEDSKYFTVHGVNMPLCVLHRLKVVKDILFYQLTEKIKQLDAFEVIGLNVDDERFFVNGTEVDIDDLLSAEDNKLASKYNQKWKDTRMEPRVKKFGALWVGFNISDMVTLKRKGLL